MKSRSVRSYQRELAQLREMIAGMLWVQPLYNGNPSCSYCGQQQHLHNKHCAASLLVAKRFPDDDLVRQQAVSKELP